MATAVAGDRRGHGALHSCSHTGKSFSPTHKAIIWPKKVEAANAAATVNVHAGHLCPYFSPFLLAWTGHILAATLCYPQMEEGPTHKGTLLSEARSKGPKVLKNI